MTVANQLATLKESIDTKGVKTDEDTALNQDLVFEDLEVEKVVSKKLQISLSDPTRKVVSASDSSTPYNLVEYMANSINICPISTNVFDSKVTFNNVVIEDEYAISQINGQLTSAYWQSGIDKEIDGTITFNAKSNFVGATTVDGTVAGTLDGSVEGT